MNPSACITSGSSALFLLFALDKYLESYLTVTQQRDSYNNKRFIFISGTINGCLFLFNIELWLQGSRNSWIFFHLLINTALGEYNSHYHTIRPFKAHKTVDFSVFTGLCGLHHFQEHCLIIPKRNPAPPAAVSHPRLLPAPSRLSFIYFKKNLLSVCTHLPVLDVPQNGTRRHAAFRVGFFHSGSCSLDSPVLWRESALPSFSQLNNDIPSCGWTTFSVSAQHWVCGLGAVKSEAAVNDPG